MNTTTLSSKGQVILPKQVRDARQWKPGTRFTVEPVENGVLLRPIKRFPPTKIEDLIGILKYKGPRKTIRQMDEGITQEVRERLARGRY